MNAIPSAAPGAAARPDLGAEPPRAASAPSATGQPRFDEVFEPRAAERQADRQADRRAERQADRSADAGQGAPPPAGQRAANADAGPQAAGSDAADPAAARGQQTESEPVETGRLAIAAAGGTPLPPFVPAGTAAPPPEPALGALPPPLRMAPPAAGATLAAGSRAGAAVPPGTALPAEAANRSLELVASAATLGSALAHAAPGGPPDATLPDPSSGMRLAAADALPGPPPAAGLASTTTAIPRGETPLTVPIDAPLAAEGWGDDFTAKVRWMVSRDVGTARLDLTPPELGPIQVKVTVRGELAHIAISTHHPLAGDAVDASVERLREALLADGFSQVDVDLGRREPGSGETGPDARHRGDASEPAGLEGHDTYPAGRPLLGLIDQYA